MKSTLKNRPILIPKRSQSKTPKVQPEKKGRARGMRHNRKWKTKRTEERKGREGKPATRAALLAKTTEMEALALQKRVDCIKTGEDDENVKDTLVAFFLRRCGLLLFCSFVLAMREKSTPQKVRKKTVKGENSVKIRNAKINHKLERKRKQHRKPASPHAIGRGGGQKPFRRNQNVRACGAKKM